MAELNTCHMTSKCNNCIHKIVCSKFIATGGVKNCEHFISDMQAMVLEVLPTLVQAMVETIPDLVNTVIEKVSETIYADMRGE